MTKNELIIMITSLKIDLDYLKRDLQFRLDGNDIEGTIKKYGDNEHKFAYYSGAFQAMVGMDNDEFKRAIKSIEKIEKNLNYGNK